jgi:endonuclease-8
MPEGDTLRQAEARLTPVLEGRTLTDAWFRRLRGYAPRKGQRVDQVDAVGKHLLIHFDRNLSLDVHLGMSGWWTVTEQPPRDAPKLRIVLSTEAGHALCYAAPTIRTYLRDGSPTPVDHLGPDLSDDVVDLDVIVERSRVTSQDRPVAELLLDQRVAAGVGNVFKSESLFLAGLAPFVAVGEVSDPDLRALWGIAHELLVANRSRSLRKTTPGALRDRTHVYDRYRLGCHRCGDAIDFDPAGSRTARSTYWCPTCQALR